MLKVDNLKKYFSLRRGLFSRRQCVYAVDDVSFAIAKGDILGLAGESGCGKTTTARVILRLTEPTDGRIYLDGRDVTRLSKRQLRDLRRDMQMIFQDPYESLNPRRSVADTIERSIDIHRLATSESEKMELVRSTLEEVGLKPPSEFAEKYPHMLSGGERQRVAIARALVIRPKFMIADEPVSMLDVSTRAGILLLLLRLREKLDISILYITHDLSTARHICDRIGIMYLGKIVEIGKTDDVLQNPVHPYAKALLSAVPVPDPTVKIERPLIRGEVPLHAIDIPTGCRFHPRCLQATTQCGKEQPDLVNVDVDHYVACFGS